MIAVAYPARLRYSLLGRPNPLAVWIGAEVLLAGLALVGVAAAAPLRREIALPWPGLSPDVALTAGLGFWLAFGLLGGLRAHERPGGSVMTFSMPFIVGGTVLGGPLAGALLGLVADLELRELRTVPWYGLLANHAVSIVSAVAAGLLGEVIRGPLQAALPGQAALALFLLAAAMAGTFAVTNLLMVIPTLALKGGIGLVEASRTYDASFRETSIGEGVLAWLMAATYLVLGWWATVACVALVLIVWQAHDASEALRHDPMTGLLNDRGFQPRLEAAVQQAEHGTRAAALLVLDLDRFWAVNDRQGYEAGDEVLRATASRLLASVRATDSVARNHRAGDEFSVLLEEVPDLATVRMVARRVHEGICRPIRLRRGDADTVAVGVSIGIVFIEPGATAPARVVTELAERRLQQAKASGQALVLEGDGVVDRATSDRRARQKRLARQPATRSGPVEGSLTVERSPGDALDP